MSYREVQGVTGKYRGLLGITKGNTGLQRVQGLKGVTRGYRKRERVTESVRGLRGITEGKKG